MTTGVCGASRSRSPTTRYHVSWPRHLIRPSRSAMPAPSGRPRRRAEGMLTRGRVNERAPLLCQDRTVSDDRLRALFDVTDVDGTEVRLRGALAAETTDSGRAEVLTQLARVESWRDRLDV